MADISTNPNLTLQVSATQAAAQFKEMTADGSTTVTGGDKRGAEQVGEILGAKVRAVILQEKRPGGLLASTR